MPHSTPSTASVSAEEHEQMLASFLEFEKNFYRNYFPLWLGTLIGPWILTAILLGVLYIVHINDPVYWWKIVNAAFWSFVLFGRFTIVASNSLGLPDSLMFWLVTYQDVMVALFFAFHVGFMYRLPWVGPKIAELSVDSEFILAHQPWMKRLTFLGLLAFIAFPLAATGSVGGAIFGRLLGLSRWAIFWGSAIGAVIGNASMLFLNKSIAKMFPALQDDPFMKWGGVPILLLIILLLERRYHSMKKAFVAQRKANSEASAETTSSSTPK
ncbi:MAG: small multi-drug export protein [Planctomycetes bacterium]|nr:small multi-drug export protein [Planctomycetota bacterium]